MVDFSDPSDVFWNNISGYPVVGNTITIKGEDIHAKEFISSKHYKKSIEKYIFEGCEFSEDFIMSLDSSVKSDFVFHKCRFKTFICESNFVVGEEYTGLIDFSDSNHQGGIKFQGVFKNRIFLNNIEVDKHFSVVFRGFEGRKYCYSDIFISGSNCNVGLISCNVGMLLIRDSGSIDKINIENVCIESQLQIKNIEALNTLRISNLDLQKDSKVLLERLKVKCFSFLKVSQDVKYMQFNEVTVGGEFFCAKVEFRNTYFNDFNIENAQKDIRKTSFIDAHLNDVKWGDVSRIYANEATFRQLKFVNDSQGSHLIANQFYAMEMRKYQEEFKGNCQARLVLWLNKVISNFGQSYVRPFFLIIAVGIIRSITICGHENDWLYRLCEPLNHFFEWVEKSLNPIASSLLPISRFLGEASNGREFIDLLFFIILSVLIWHFVVALKRHTKR